MTELSNPTQLFSSSLSCLLVLLFSFSPHLNNATLPPAPRSLATRSVPHAYAHPSSISASLIAPSFFVTALVLASRRLSHLSPSVILFLITAVMSSKVTPGSHSAFPLWRITSSAKRKRFLRPCPRVQGIVFCFFVFFYKRSFFGLLSTCKQIF